MLIEKPNIGKMANVPMSDTGTASSGISVARQLWQEQEDHNDDQHDRFPKRRNDLFHALRDGQRRIHRDRIFQACGKPCFRSAICALTWLATARALEPGAW